MYVSYPTDDQRHDDATIPLPEGTKVKYVKGGGYNVEEVMKVDAPEDGVFPIHKDFLKHDD